jgi:Mrp family chromosome partitioning ATPase/capsular polysaccharide biosynthesis protein
MARPRIPVGPGAPEFGRTERGGEPGAFEPYLRALRSHAVLAVAIVLAVYAGSIAWLSVREPVYSASAQLLVTPLDRDDRSFFGLPLVRDSGDPTRTLQTAATLADSSQAAVRAARAIGDGWTEQRVRSATEVLPQGESNILAVEARASTPERAAEVANAFATAVIEVRRVSLQRLVRAAIAETTEQLSRPGLAPGVQADLSTRLSDLRSIRGGTDPTLVISEPASVSSAPEGLAPWLVLVLAVVAGLVLAAGATLILELLTPRAVQREAELLAIDPLPVLARIPPLARRFGRGRRRGAVLPLAGPAANEGFRLLQLQLELSGGRPRSVLFTSPSPGDGKTSSIVGFARELAVSGRSAILIDLDFRRPGLTAALGVEPTQDITAALDSGEGLKAALTPVPRFPSLRVAAAPQHATAALLGRLGPALPDLLDDALRLADYVLIDTPALGEVGDALLVAQDVDHIVVICRLGHTKTRSLETVRDLLARTGRPPSGYLLIGGTSRGQGGYDYVTVPAHEPGKVGAREPVASPRAAQKR